MTVQEEWRKLRKAGPDMERGVLAAAFCEWTERFTAEDEGEDGGCFRHWRRLPEEVRAKLDAASALPLRYPRTMEDGMAERRAAAVQIG